MKNKIAMSTCNFATKLHFIKKKKKRHVSIFSNNNVFDINVPPSIERDLFNLILR